MPLTWKTSARPSPPEPDFGRVSFGNHLKSVGQLGAHCSPTRLRWQQIERRRTQAQAERTGGAGAMRSNARHLPSHVSSFPKRACFAHLLALAALAPRLRQPLVFPVVCCKLSRLTRVQSRNFGVFQLRQREKREAASDARHFVFSHFRTGGNCGKVSHVRRCGFVVRRHSN
jgi:hypothetical protein